MADKLSQQDLQDLDEVARRLPKGDPRIEGIRTLIRAQQETTAPAPTFGERLTAGYNPNAAEFGSVVRFLDAAGGALLNAPGAVYHAFADPVTPEEAQRQGYKPGDGRAAINPLDRLLIHPAKEAAQTYANPATRPSFSEAMSVLPEALGTGVSAPASGELLARSLPFLRNLPQTASSVRASGRNAIYKPLPPSGGGPVLTRGANAAAKGTGAAIGAGIGHSVPIPGSGYVGGVAGFEFGPSILRRMFGTPELGDIRNPGPYSKVPVKSKPPSPSPSPEAPPVANPAASSSMQRPLRPTIGTEEEFQIYDRQMSRLKTEAKAAGMYSAARGKVGKKLNYQQRIKQKF